jgi:hypothetical protein
VLPVRAIAVGWGRQGAFWLLHFRAARGFFVPGRRSEDARATSEAEAEALFARLRGCLCAVRQPTAVGRVPMALSAILAAMAIVAVYKQRTGLNDVIKVT